MTAALGGLDALAFSGGVGENREDVRRAIVERLRYLGEFRVEVVEAREDVIDRAHRPAPCSISSFPQRDRCSPPTLPDTHASMLCPWQHARARSWSATTARMLPAVPWTQPPTSSAMARRWQS